jgi:acetoacetyl-CoA synthetase
MSLLVENESSTSVHQSQTPNGPLYQPTNPEVSCTFEFLRLVNNKYGLSLASYYELYKWSTTRIDDFWGTVWDATGIIGQKGDHIVDASATPSANPLWFSQAKLNWAENMLQCRSPKKIALIQAGALYTPC